VAFSFKPWLGDLFLVAYALYFWKEMRSEVEATEHDLEPLKLRPRSADPGAGSALLQTVFALVVIAIGNAGTIGLVPEGRKFKSCRRE
jgi:cation:H+ antiporter